MAFHPLQETVMDPTHHLHRSPTEWLRESPLASYVDAFTHHFAERRYSSNTVGTYLGCVAHFVRWTTRCRLDLCRIDEEAVRRFLEEHLPRCNCAGPVRGTRRDLRAALGHLLVVLRANGVIAKPSVGTTPVDDELRRFDEHMHHVRGLAPKTRILFLRTVRRLLTEQFANQPVVLSSIKPDDLRGFVARQSELYSTPANTGTLASALRGYFRFRAACGDQVHGLIGVVCYPANWQLASLPKALSAAEIERLLGALGHDGPSARRADAIVRCALDLGLRSSEVAKLGLDDIDWHAGTVTLRGTKSRREDILPLPAATGRAIADYLKFERPQTTNRAVFVRHIAPRDQPIGPDVVGKAIRQAYARAGLPYTRAHLLRHTMASRLLAGGSSLKEVADVLRHRSLNTTLIYAKLDSRNLAAVALAWPGCAA
jgi:integrase/recombinase XerC